MSGYVLAAIGVSVACTLGLRALPFLIFTKNRPMPEWLKRLGNALPMAIMAVLVVYSSEGRVCRSGQYRRSAGAGRGGRGCEL